MKKLILLVSIIFLFTSCGNTSYSPNRHQYHSENRIDLSLSQENLTEATVISVPDEYKFRNTAVASDLILAGTVIDEGVPGTQPVFRELMYDGPVDPYIEFEIQIRNVWFGKCDENTIKVRIIGDYETAVTKPQYGDEVILFLVKEVYWPEGYWYYLTTGNEESIFAINPPTDCLYAFAEQNAIWDGQRIEQLNKAINDEIKSLNRIKTEEDALNAHLIRLGDCCDGILDNNSFMKSVYESSKLQQQERVNEIASETFGGELS